MSAYDWIKCPKGCKEDENRNVVRVDLDWYFNATGAYIMLNCECQVCGLTCKLEAEKKPKKIITDITF